LLGTLPMPNVVLPILISTSTQIGRGFSFLKNFLITVPR